MRILHILAQRPLLTGSGVTYDALIRETAAIADATPTGIVQHGIYALAAGDETPDVGGLPAASFSPIRFESDALPFPIAGMSDVMPYRTSVWSALTTDELVPYRAAWREHILRVAERFRPDVVHTHHVWLMSALVAEVLPDVPQVIHCHATGLRQLELTPHLASEVLDGCAQASAIVTLQPADADRLGTLLEGRAPRPGNTDTPPRIPIGAGYRTEVFNLGDGSSDRPERDDQRERDDRRERDDQPHRRERRDRLAIAYAGRFSHAKGLSELLDAVERLGGAVTLHVAGTGKGDEAARLEARMQAMPSVVLHGHLGQSALAALLRRVGAFVLPSYYEGLGLVLVEAAACGCRVIANDLETLRDALADPLGDWLTWVPPPRLEGPDTPIATDLPGYVGALTDAILTTLDEAPIDAELDADAIAERLAPFTWRAITKRLIGIWRDVAGD